MKLVGVSLTSPARGTILVDVRELMGRRRIPRPNPPETPPVLRAAACCCAALRSRGCVRRGSGVCLAFAHSLCARFLALIDLCGMPGDGCLCGMPGDDVIVKTETA